MRDLVEHVVVGNKFTAQLLAGVARKDACAALTDAQLGQQPVAAVVESARLQVQAFAVTPPEQPVAGPNGSVPAAGFLRFRLVDLVVHGWDLRRAVGLDETIDQRLVLDLMAQVRPHLADMVSLRAYGAGPSGALPPGASPQLHLLDWFGRRP